MNPGEVWWADIPEAGLHPIVILSRSGLNRGHRVNAALVTSSKFATRSTQPHCVILHAGEFGLERDCVVQADTFTPIPLEAIDQIRGRIGTLEDERLREVIRAVGYVMDSDCEPC